LSITCTTLPFTLSAATALILVAQATSRRLLFIANTGVNPVTIKFQSAPASATDGFTLDAASASGAQGGSILLTANDTPVDAVYAYSTLGTTVTLTHGNPYA
jgi:hypothetical protein